jgi:hypothetical protein
VEFVGVMKDKELNPELNPKEIEDSLNVVVYESVGLNII